jgi:phosphoglycerate kinase
LGLFHKKTLYDIDIAGKRVLLRADYNVPMNKDGTVASAYRIEQSLPTIRALQEKGCQIVICSHLGRPKGPDDTSCSLKPVARELSHLLGQDILFVPECVGDSVKKAVSTMKSGDIVLLENVRFHPEEEANDTDFAHGIIESSGAEVFVQDGFGVVHRAHATTDAIARQLPAVAGLLLEKEVDTITRVMAEPARPLMAIIGGAKIADKIDIIHKFIDSADVVVIGGAMANTFLKAQGVEIKNSLIDDDKLDTAHDVMDKVRRVAKERQFVFYLPQDGVVASEIDKTATTRIVDWDAHVIADIEAYPNRPKYEASHIRKDEKILDVGPFSGAFIAGVTQLVNTVVWNGTMGVTEVNAVRGPVGPFSHGTELVIDALVGKYGHRPFSLLGGGDTSAYIEERGMNDMFNHVSTGGGASLELMAGRELPGVSVLWDKEG